VAGLSFERRHRTVNSWASLASHNNRLRAALTAGVWTRQPDAALLLAAALMTFVVGFRRAQDDLAVDWQRLQDDVEALAILMHERRGSLYLLERLELVKTLEFRLRYSAAPDSAEFIFAWLQLTPFGLEVYRHCVIPFEKAPPRKNASKTKRKTKRKAPRT
jgi:hypothetical protein